jgi:hypothetical protein
MEESQFTQAKKEDTFWAFGVINNEFRLESTLKKDSNSIKGFANNYIGRDNTIETDG